MAREDVSIVHLIYQRDVDGVKSFLTIPIALRKEWVDYRLVTGMADLVKEVRNLERWEFICYYHDLIRE